MAPRPMKVKVKTAELLKAVEAKRAERAAAFATAQSEYELAQKQYEKDRKAWLAAVAAACSKAIKESVAEDNIDIYSYSRSDQVTIHLPHEVALPPRPTPPRKPVNDLQRVDRTIATLKIAAEDAISISADDYAEYLGS